MRSLPGQVSTPMQATSVSKSEPSLTPLILRDGFTGTYRAEPRLPGSGLDWRGLQNLKCFGNGCIQTQTQQLCPPVLQRDLSPFMQSSLVLIKMPPSHKRVHVTMQPSYKRVHATTMSPSPPLSSHGHLSLCCSLDCLCSACTSRDICHGI